MRSLRSNRSRLLGWSNGFLQSRGPGANELMNCLNGMDAEQAVAMIDKYYKEHPERWSRPFGEEIPEALTVAGGPCQGKLLRTCAARSTAGRQSP